MEATVARIREFMRNRLSGERVWRIDVSASPDSVRVTLHTPDKPAKLTDERDKKRAPKVELLEAELKTALGRDVVINVVQAPSAVAKYVRISPRKCRFVVDVVRNKPVQDALAILQFTPNSAAQTVSKLIKSAMANAENNHRMDAETLEVMHVHVDEGPQLKRVSPRSMGRAYRILKRTSHITVALGETEKKARIASKGKGVARTVAKAPRRGGKAAAAEGAKPRKSAAKEKTAAPAAEAGKTAKPKAPRKRDTGGGK